MVGTRIGMGSLYVSGQTVKGGYRIMRKLGEGGMGAVYEVEQVDTGNTYALKTLFPDMMRHEGYAERFEREARIMKELKHPNVVEIVAYNVDGVPFLVMERLYGIDLTLRILQAGFLTFEESLEILTPVVKALKFAHSRPRPVIHRDLKPDNIFLCSDGTPKLLDFGIAKRLINEGDIATVLTMAGTAMGTTNFMSPEQARGEVHAIDQRTDIFALGAILYQMLSGRYAFDGQGMPVLLKIMGENPTPLAQLGVDVPEGVQGVIDRALAKDKWDRYPTVTAFLADLIKIDQGMRPTPKRMDQGMRSARSPEKVRPSSSSTKHYGQRQASLDLLSSVTVSSESDVHVPPAPRKSRAGLILFLGALAVGGGVASYYTNKPPQVRRFVDKTIDKIRGRKKIPAKQAFPPEPKKAEKKKIRSKSRRKGRKQYMRRGKYRRGARRR